MLLILWVSTQNVPERYARGSNYVMPRAGSHWIMCGVCQQQQTDVPGKAPLQEGAGLSQKPHRRVRDVAARPLLEQPGPWKAGAGGRQSADTTSLSVVSCSQVQEWQGIFQVFLLPCVFASSVALFFFSLLLDPEKKNTKKGWTFLETTHPD